MYLFSFVMGAVFAKFMLEDSFFWVVIILVWAFFVMAQPEDI